MFQSPTPTLVSTHSDSKTGRLRYWKLPTKCYNVIKLIPVVPARGGAEVALGLCYKTFLIYSTCMRRARARPVRAYFFPNCCDAVQDARDPGAMQGQVNTFFTLRTALFTPRTPHFTLALHTPHFISMADVNNHSLQNTKEEPIRPRNDRSRTRRTQDLPFITGCSHITRKKRKDSCSGFLPNAKPMQQSCSHYNAFCSTTYTSMQPLQCDLHPHNAICIHMLQNTKGEPIRPRNDRSRTRRTQDVPFIAGSSHIERKNTWFRAAFSSPKQNGDDSLRDLFVFQSGAVFFCYLLHFGAKISDLCAICCILEPKSAICVLFAAFLNLNLSFCMLFAACRSWSRKFG